MHKAVFVLSCVAGLLASGPGRAQSEDFCDVAPCQQLCFPIGFDAGFEANTRAMYALIASIPIVGDAIDLDRADLNLNGIPDVAQARLLDSVLRDGSAPNHCCAVNAYLQNLVIGQTAAVAITSSWPDDIFGIPVPPLPESDVIAGFLAGAFTSGQDDIVDLVIGIVSLLVPDIPLEGIVNDGAEPYVDVDGDADRDGVCNRGEYNATVVVVPDDYDAFVLAALTDTSVEDGGGCPDCSGEGEGEGEVLVEGEGEGETIPLPATTERTAQELLLRIEGLAGADRVLSFDEANALFGGDLPESLFNEMDADGFGTLDQRELTNTSALPVHAADVEGNNAISLSNLLRVVQFFAMNGYRCDPAKQAPTQDDGYLAGPPATSADRDCLRHSADYDPFDFDIRLSELLRVVQFFNENGYRASPPGTLTEDGYVAESEDLR